MVNSSIRLGATEALAQYSARVATTLSANLPAVARSLLDTIAVAIAAQGEPGEEIVRNWVLGEGARGSATIWASGDKTSASLAAFANGNAGHVLDFDDISPTMPMHPGTVLFPAIIALAEARGISGAVIARAADVGAAIFRALAEALPQDLHYGRGWHTTATVGRLAATGALSCLIGLDVTQTRHAIGQAVSSVAGTRANFGTMTKPLHAGAAARDAIIAVTLAEVGVTGDLDALEAAGGFFELYGDGQPRELDVLLQKWDRAWPSDWGLKRYPACYATHRAVDACLAIRSALGDREIERVDVAVHPRGLQPLIAHLPRSANEAKFSMNYVVALALAAGEVRLGHFVDDYFNAHSLDSLLRRVEAYEVSPPHSGSANSGGEFAVVTVQARDGSVLSERVDITHGDSRRPLSDAEFRIKFDDCCSKVLDPHHIEELYASVHSLLGDGDIRDLGQVFTRASARREVTA